MIVGTVSRFGEAFVRLEFRLEDGSTRFADAMIDTGYTGSLTLPQSVIDSFGLTRKSTGQAILANGLLCDFDVFEALFFVWHNGPIHLSVSSVGSVPLIGMKLLRGSELRIDVEVDGHIQITPLPFSGESSSPDFTPN